MSEGAGKAIRVLVVDDSALLRKMISENLAMSPGIDVVGTAQNGKIALRKIEDLSPDIITLDFDMPVMDGLETLTAIMESDAPKAVIMFSSYTRQGADTTLRALEIGAVDYISKPDGKMNTMQSVMIELTAKIRALVNFRPRSRRPTAPSSKEEVEPQKKISNRVAEYLGVIDSEILVGIGISTGGPNALTDLFSTMGQNSPAIAVVQHMPENFVPALASRLNRLSGMDICVAEEGMELVPGRCLISPGDRHLTIKKERKRYVAKLNKGVKVSGHMPAADVLLPSVGKAAEDRSIGVLMTGMGRDGVEGMTAIKQCGGRTIAQDESSSVVYGMPRAAFESGCVDQVLSLEKLPGGILELSSLPERV